MTDLTTVDPRHEALKQSFESAFAMDKQADTPSHYKVQQYFEPIQYPQAIQILKRLEQTQRPVIDAHYFRLHAFRKAKEAMNWDIPEGSYAFNYIDLTKVFLDDLSYNVPFDCYFLKTSNGSPFRAWLHRNNEGVVRYYMENPIKKEEKYFMDVVDLYGISNEFYRVVDYDKKRYLRHQSFELVREHQTIRQSIGVINEKERLRVLHNQVTKQFNATQHINTDRTLQAVLHTLIEEAQRRTFVESAFDEQGRVVFFMSTSELTRRIKTGYANIETVKKGKATLNNAVNILVGLGFLRKLSDKELYEANDDLVLKRNSHARGGKNPISYYTLNDLPSAYWVRKQADKLLNKGVSMHNLTERQYERVYGRELTKKTFVGTFVEKKTDDYHIEKEAYREAFYWHLKQEGYVTKDMLNGIIPSSHVTNKLWTLLANETRGIYAKRTTKKVRKLLGIESTGALFVAHAMVHPFEPVALHVTLAEENERAIEETYDNMVNSALQIFGMSPPQGDGEWLEASPSTPSTQNEKVGMMPMSTHTTNNIEKGEANA